MRFVPVLGTLFLCGSSAMAQSADCDEQAIVWSAAATLTAATGEEDARTARLSVGQPIMIALRPDPEVAFAITPQREVDGPSFGGLVNFEATQAGQYRVWLEEAAWVDVVENGKPADTVTYGRAPECSGMHKQVTFDLDAGNHLLQISRNADADVGALVEIVAAD